LEEALFAWWRWAETTTEAGSEGAEFIVPVKRHSLLVLGIHKHGEGRRGTLRDAIGRVHQDRRNQAAAAIKQLAMFRRISWVACVCKYRSRASSPQRND
jgi:hypothetical protein